MFGKQFVGKFMKLFLVIIAMTLTGCASPKYAGTRTIINNITPGTLNSISIASLDPNKINEFRQQALESILQSNLTTLGVKTTFSKNEYPDAIFLIGYAVDPGLNADWERRITVIGFDFKSGKSIYQMKYVSEGSSKDIVQFGQVVIKDAVIRSNKTGLDSGEFQLEIIK